MHVIDGQKLLITYVCCYILSCRHTVMPSLNKISYLILSYPQLCIELSTVPRGIVLTILPNKHEITVLLHNGS